MSFTLRVKNAPSGSVRWWADYNNTQIYSGWLDINQTWNCPYGAYGATDLHIWIVDASNNTKHEKSGLGPVYDGKEYEYNCSTGVFSEVGVEPGFSQLEITSFSKA